MRAFGGNYVSKKRTKAGHQPYIRKPRAMSGAAYQSAANALGISVQEFARLRAEHEWRPR